MNTQRSLFALVFVSLSLVLSTTSCIKEGCDDRVSTEFTGDQAQWLPYNNGPDKTVFKKEGEEVYDTLKLDSYEFKVIMVQNTENCDKEETHELQRAELFLQSSPNSTGIALFQSSEDVGLFSVTHDERELFFFYREKRFEIDLDLYKYFPTYTLDGNSYTDVLEITCNEETTPCPNYKKLVYQKGGGLIAYELNDALWHVIN